MSEKGSLQRLQTVLKNMKAPDSVTAVEQDTFRLPSGKLTVHVNNDDGKKAFELPVLDGAKLTWERQGMPGKFAFEAPAEKKYKVDMGDKVKVFLGKTKIFVGYIFTAQNKKDKLVSYTAYDQIRYLKNKDTLVYKKKTADELIRMLADRFKLQCGKLAETGYRRSAIEDNTTLMDMIQNALDDTLRTKGKSYVLYDEVGKLRLVDVASMKVNTCLVDAETGEDFSYKCTIDSDVYNQIKLIYENKKKGTLDLYVARDSRKISKWGMLQYVDKIDSPDIGKMKTNALLKLYDQENRTLSVSGVIGNRNVRGGSLVPVILNLGSVKVSNYMMVEKVTHIFNNGQYTMDLVLSGGGFSA